MSKADSFGTFLETLKRRETGQKASIQGSFNLLASLAESGPAPVAELMHQSGLRITDFAELLNAMREAGLIILTGQPGHETVELTANGERLARLER